MKTLYTTACLIFLITTTLIGQTLVSPNPMNRNALIEEFTGIHCNNCPAGHNEGHDIMKVYPNKVNVIAIHQGGYALPYDDSEPDYTTTFADAIAENAGVQFYPSGTVNRQVFIGQNSAMDLSHWKGSSEQIMKEVSPVNLGVSTSYDETTRNLKIDIELFYTSTPSSSTNYLNIALIQDSIKGPQAGGEQENNYNHMKMLRHFITGQWGEKIENVTEGTLIRKSYNYTLPTEYNNIPTVAENMHVIAFIAKSKEEVYTAETVSLINGTNLYIGSLDIDIPYISSNINEQNDFHFKAISNLNGSLPFTFTMEKINCPSDYQVSFIIDGQEYSEEATVNLYKGVQKNILLRVKTGTTVGLSSFKLKMKSDYHQNAPTKSKNVSVLSAVTDLIVNGTGGSESEQYQGVYYDGLINSNINTTAVVNANDLVNLYKWKALGNTKNIWLNISWTFPTLTDEQAIAIMNMMDERKNIFIAGQDIGWDIMSGDYSAQGTETTKNFFTNYLNAIYVKNGNLHNNKLNPIEGEDLLGTINSSNIIDLFGGFISPDEIAPNASAVAIATYNTPDKIAAIRYENSYYRSIYFGIGLEMIEDVSVRNMIIGISQVWLTSGTFSVEDAINNISLGKCYPNPAKDFTYIPVPDSFINGKIEVYNTVGKKVIEKKVTDLKVEKLNTSQLSSGVYFYRIVIDNKISNTEKLIIR